MTVKLARALLVMGLCVLNACNQGQDTTPGPQLTDGDTSTVAANNLPSTLNANWKLGPFAELYVRGYKDSDGDGIGDLKGVIQKLGYLDSLGVTGIWLMPVTTSEDKDHGYAVTDYRAIEPQFGTMADFDELLRQAHARGIGVIMDYVINHSAGLNPLFLNSRSATNAAMRDWYVWSSTKPSGWTVLGGDPWYSAVGGYYYAAFWIGMPEFNFRNPQVVTYHQNNMRFWLNRGVDGFRFDAVGNLVENGPNGWRLQPETYTVMGKMRTTLDAYPNRYMVCEAPDDPIGFAAPAACGGSFAFNHNKDIVRAVKGDAAAIRTVAEYSLTAPIGMATMLANHDGFAGERVWDQLAGDVTSYKLAAATYLLQPGVPFVYYGEEIGMAGGAGLDGDHKLRSPMSWTNDASNGGFSTTTPFRALAANTATHNVRAEESDPASLLSFYRALIALRRSRASLSNGSYERAMVNGLVMSFARTSATQKTLVLINYGASQSTTTFEGLPPGAVVRTLFPASIPQTVVANNGQLVINADSRSVKVLGIDQ